MHKKLPLLELFKLNKLPPRDIPVPVNMSSIKKQNFHSHATLFQSPAPLEPIKYKFYHQKVLEVK